MSQDAVVTKKKHPGGRPTKYRAAMIDTMLSLPPQKQNPANICQALGVIRETLYIWRDRIPEFCEAFKKCKENYEGYWLALAQSRAEGHHQGSDILIKFMLSAACGYRDSTDIKQVVDAKIEHSGSVDLNFVDITPVV